MGFQLGRAGLATASGGDGFTIRCGEWSQEGDEVRCGGVIRGSDFSSLADWKAARAQLAGYHLNVDEPVVPVTWTEDPSVDGFYRVQSVKVESEATGRLRANADGAELAVRWSAELVRVPGFTAPLFEVVCNGADRTNTHGLTGNGWVAIPAASISRSYPTATADTFAAVTTSSFFIEADALYDDTVKFAVTPANHYNAAAFLTVDDSVVTGTQIANDTGWELSNGLVRVKAASNANQITVGVRNSGATAYDDKDYRFGYYDTEAREIGYDGSSTRDSWTAPTVLRNSPECVSVRLHLSITGINQFDAGGALTGLNSTSVFLDLTVRRGAFWVEGRFANDAGDGVTSKLGVWRSATEAGTAITGGIEATSADGATNKYRIYTPVTRTADTTYGGLYATSARADLPFAIGNNRTFGSFTVANGYFAAMNHRQKIVAR